MVSEAAWPSRTIQSPLTAGNNADKAFLRKCFPMPQHAEPHRVLRLGPLPSFSMTLPYFIIPTSYLAPGGAAAGVTSGLYGGTGFSLSNHAVYQRLTNSWLPVANCFRMNSRASSDPG